MSYVIWLSGWPNPAHREMQVWPDDIASFTLDGKPHPRKLCEIDLDAADVGKTIGHLSMMERYALPARFKTTIDGEKVELVSKPAPKVEQQVWEVI